jgi:PhnB protein
MFRSAADTKLICTFKLKMKGTNTKLNPYLTFNGNCREAMTFYKDALHGELNIQTFEESPMEVPPEQKDRVMHATLTFGDAIIMASDGMPENEVIFGNSISLSIAAKAVEDGERIFKNLSSDGTVVMPWEKTFWGAMFGMCKDKFGIDWMVNAELKEE